MKQSDVYLIRDVLPENLVRIYETLGCTLAGRVAVKLHSGEEGNQNYIRPEFVKPLIEQVGGTVVECNTAYEGERNTTQKHEALMEKHGWSRYFKVDIMDADEDMVLEDPKRKAD